MTGVECESLVYDFREEEGYVRAALPEGRQFPGDDGLHHLEVAEVLAEHALSSEQFPCNDRERVDIGRARHLVSLNLLRGQVRCFPLECSGSRGIHALRCLGDAKVQQFHHTVYIDHQVVGAQVAMDDFLMPIHDSLMDGVGSAGSLDE